MAVATILLICILQTWVVMLLLENPSPNFSNKALLEGWPKVCMIIQISPGANKVAKAVAEKDSVPIQPAEAHAEN